MRMRAGDARRIAEALAPAYAGLHWLWSEPEPPTPERIAEVILGLAKGVRGNTVAAASGGITVARECCEGCAELGRRHCEEPEVSVSFVRRFILPLGAP